MSVSPVHMEGSRKMKGPSKTNGGSSHIEEISKAISSGGASDLSPRGIEVEINGRMAILLPITVEDLDGLSEIVEGFQRDFEGKESISQAEAIKYLVSSKIARKVLKFVVLRSRSDDDGKPKAINPEIMTRDLDRILATQAFDLIEIAVRDLGMGELLGKAARGMARFQEWMAAITPDPRKSPAV